MQLGFWTHLVSAVVFVLLLFQLELGFRGKCQGKIGKTCYQPSKRKSWKTGLLTPPKETAAARAVRLVPRVGYCKQGQVQFHPLASCNTSSMNIKKHSIWCLIENGEWRNTLFSGRIQGRFALDILYR